MKTLKNKVYGTSLLLVGLIPAILYKDGTALILFGCIGLPMILSKENWIY